MLSFVILIITIFITLILVFLVLRIGSWIQFKISFLHDPVYIPSTPQAIAAMLELAQAKNGEVIIDLGSGDGRVLLAFAQKGCVCIGYEINPVLVWKSRLLAKKNNVEQIMHFYCKSFWHADLSEANTIILFATASSMNRLEEKIQQESRKGTKIVSQRFCFPTLKIRKQILDSFLYWSS